jgi:hypothetical protein
MTGNPEGATPPPPQPLRLHSGAALKFSEIDRITRRCYTPIVFLSGETASGKTTLLGSIHDAFQFGPFADYMFAGSETLMAFEEKCFEARARSGASQAHTTRTRYEAGQEYLHLRVKAVEPGSPQRDVLFADMSGEFYERAIQSNGELTEFGILRRSDHLVLLLDGKKLMDPAARQKVRNDGMQFIRRCREVDLLRNTTSLQIMISKWDLVLGENKEAGDKLLQFIKSKFSESVLTRTVSVIPIAARPEPPSPVKKLFGVDDVFKGWVETIPVSLRQMNKKFEAPVSRRLFNRIPVE